MTRIFDHVVLGAGIAGVWLTRALLRRGRTVALVEIGGMDHPVPAEPAVVFAERENLGVTRARNHVFSGNSRYWGGGLIRNDALSLRRMFGFEDGSRELLDLTDAYVLLERELGISAAARRDVAGNGVLSQISVLPGRRRDFIKDVLTPFLASDRLALFRETRVEEVSGSSEGRISSLRVASADGRRLALTGREYVLAMGVVDTNIFALKHLREMSGRAGPKLGSRLHDHWSVPIARIKWKSGTGFDALYPPRFSRGSVLGSRIEAGVTCPWGYHGGFIHIQADYDHIEPYSSIKKCMEGRQRGAPPMEMLRRAAPLLRRIPALARIGYGRFLEQRLFVPEGTELNVVLDYESFASESNRFVLNGPKAELFWDIRPEDIGAFERLLPIVFEHVRRLAASSNIAVTPLVGAGRRGDLESFLRQNAIDAYHLGGGLPVGPEKDGGVLDENLRFHEIKNLSVIGTAAFGAPGVANPVETILGLCERYAASSVMLPGEKSARQ